MLLRYSDTEMKQLRVLIAELVPGYSAVLRQHLAQRPFLTIVGEAEDGEEALRLVIETKPDYFIMAATLMKLQGWEVLERIPPDAMPQWIIVTGSYGEDDYKVQKALARGAHRYAIPFNPLWTEQVMLDLLREYEADLEAKRKRFKWYFNLVENYPAMLRRRLNDYRN